MDQREPGKLKPMQELGDEELLKLYRSNADPEIIGLLYTRYTHLVFGNCFRYLENEEMARDAVMEIFERLFETLKTDEIRHFSSWLFQVSRNHCLMQIRQDGTKQKHLKVIRAEKEEEFMESGFFLHLKDEEDEEKKKRINFALEKLNDEQRQCIKLMYLEGLSYKEIADLTGFELKAVKSHIQNGKRNLRVILDKASWLIILLIIWIK